jgi:hypothetical protein
MILPNAIAVILLLLLAKSISFEVAFVEPIPHPSPSEFSSLYLFSNSLTKAITGRMIGNRQNRFAVVQIL